MHFVSLFPRHHRLPSIGECDCGEVLKPLCLGVMVDLRLREGEGRRLAITGTQGGRPTSWHSGPTN